MQNMYSKDVYLDTLDILSVPLGQHLVESPVPMNLLNLASRNKLRYYNRPRHAKTVDKRKQALDG